MPIRPSRSKADRWSWSKDRPDGEGHCTRLPWTRIDALIQVFGDLIQIKAAGAPPPYAPCLMNGYRRRRLRAQLSILAIVALLWSQVLLAGHLGCSMTAMALGEAAVPMAIEHGCPDSGPSDESIVCAAHCSQGDLSGEVGRVPPVPALLPTHAVGVSSIAVLDADRAPYIGLPLAVSWHRPTAHPASLLLL